MKITRRRFTQALGSVAFIGLASNLAACQGKPVKKATDVYGALQLDPNGLLDLPKGFSYKIISSFEEKMSDGYNVPDRADGMGCFDLGDNKIALVRNHEMKKGHTGDGPFAQTPPQDIPFYDRLEDGDILPGGTTTIHYDMATHEKTNEFLSLVGTIRNCSGGITPWGTWLTCEEDMTLAGDDVEKNHGWVFEVPAAATGPVEAVPLKGMGRFNHEAAAVDPRTGIVYLTEDRDDSLFYRFIPNVQGQLDKGGKLQALAFKDAPNGADSRNWDNVTFTPGSSKEVFWVDLEDTDSPKDDLRIRGHKKGAAIFARGEGVHWGDNELFFCCTSGGAEKIGQIMCYKPSITEGKPSTIKLFLESTDKDTFNFGDNLTVSPDGHLIVCEDQYSLIVNNHLRGVTPDGRLYDFAKLNAQTEMAGACFSPDGSTLFVNVYSPTKTLAITGPWKHLA